MTGTRTGTNPVLVERANPATLLRLRRMGRTLRMTDQLLTYDLDSLVLVENGTTGAPAWTAPDGSVITIDVSKMPSLYTRKGIAVWLGTNAHELFHNLWSPRSGSVLMRRIGAAERSTSRGIHRSWNILEDQRIERLGLARYGAWTGYLIAALSHHIPVTHEGAWVLVAGRTWLTDEVRAIARGTFAATNGDAAARRAAELIGDYQRLSDPGDDDADEAWAIVNEFHTLFGEAIPPKGGCGTRPVEGGEPEPGDDGSVSESIPTADEADDEDEDDESDDDEAEGGSEGDESDDDEAEGFDGDDDDEDGDEGEGDDGDDDGDGSGDESESDTDDDDDDDFGSDGDGSDDGEAEGDGDEADDEADDGMAGDNGESSDDGEPGDGTSESDGVRRTMAEAMDEAIEDALDADDTSADLDRVVDQVENGNPGGGDLQPTTGEWHDVTDAARRLSREVTDVLAAIKDDNEAAWVRRTDTGRFNVGRWATDPTWDADDVFDEFQPGAMDASSLDCVLVLDVSGSMSSDIFTLAEATWAIRTAIDRVEGNCTTIGFGDVATMIFDTGTRPDGRIFVPELEGSTYPTPAAREAHRIVAGSMAANKVVIVLTDGDWGGYDQTEAALRACQGEGATVAIVGLGGYCRKIVPGFMGADVVERIGDASELVPIFREIAERSMLASARRQG
jgi:hypothetical protein